MEKAYQLSKKIIDEIEDYSKDYTTNDGKIGTTDFSLKKLNMIIEDGLVLYKYCIDKKLYDKYQSIIPLLNGVADIIEKLQINQENAKKLNLSSAIQIWQQGKISIALLACEIMDIYEGK